MWCDVNMLKKVDTHFQGSGECGRIEGALEAGEEEEGEEEEDPPRARHHCHGCHCPRRRWHQGQFQ